MWFWYAVLERHGERLYSTMHLPLQPLFILLTAWGQELFGLSWLGSKILAVLQLAAFCCGLFLIARVLPWKDWQRALLLAAVFCLTMAPIYARFDDYHVTGYCFAVYSLLLLLRLRTEVRGLPILVASAVLGVLAGLSVSNRLNDGAALTAASGIALCLIARRHKIAAVLCFLVLTAGTFLLVILLTHDSLHDWWLRTVVLAAAIKGGTGNIFLAPLKLPIRMARLIRQQGVAANLVAEILLTTSFAYLSARRERGQFSLRDRNTIIAIGTAVLSAGLLLEQSRRSRPEEAATEVGVFVSLALGALVLFRVVRALHRHDLARFNVSELLLFFPGMQLLAGAMTSGVNVLEAFAPIALLLLVLPIAYPRALHRTMPRVAYLVLATILLICCTIYKICVPYSWHHFRDRALFIDREWYDHPVYGELYIESDQLAFMRQVCTDVSADGPTTELLSLQNPYPNYFCNVAPWHDYIQTWYDTTSEQTIDALDTQLNASPPKWIVYQRALDTMQAHEMIFSNGRALPHRKLDRLIMDQISQGKWKVVQRQWFEGADWIVIRTHG